MMLIGRNPMKCKKLVDEFVEKAIINQNTIEVFFKVSVVSSGGGGGS